MPFVSDADDDGDFAALEHESSPCELLVDVVVEVRPGGTTYAWGNGQNGRLGLGNPELAPFQDGYEALTDTTYRFVDTPTPVVALVGHEMAQLVSGSAHNVAVTTEGRVFTWGKGSKGELATTRTPDDALRATQDQWIPRQLEHLRYERVVHAAANDACSAFVSELVHPEIYLQRRKEIAHLKAVARRSLV
ncbi:hypothetical protein PINS_up004797 [Pythium insidiosum]|nr:hypothetical protein PINS_up004797 [Pythium insidiosum]